MPPFNQSFSSIINRSVDDDRPLYKLCTVASLILRSKLHSCTVFFPNQINQLRFIFVNGNIYPNQPIICSKNKHSFRFCYFRTVAPARLILRSKLHSCVYPEGNTFQTGIRFCGGQSKISGFCSSVPDLVHLDLQSRKASFWQISQMSRFHFIHTFQHINRF